MRIYLDNCCIQRPFDDQFQQRIKNESIIIEEVLAKCRDREYELVSSEVLRFENSKTRDETRQDFVRLVLEDAQIEIPITDTLFIIAQRYYAIGIKPLDALHLASAEVSKAEFFCTSDDTLLKKAKRINDLPFKVVNPIELKKGLLL